MIRDITLGQYYNKESAIHRLDPRIKIMAACLFAVEIFISDSFVGLAACAAAAGAVVALSGVPFSFMMRGLRPILIIMIFTFCLNIFMADGRVLWRLGFLKVTEEGIYKAFYMASRLFLLIIGSSLLTFTTKPISLTDGMESLLSPFAKIGLPAHEIAMMMSIALRFIPTLLDETDKIMKAQQARGADFESGNLIRRAKALIPILVPLFVSVFRIAQELAMAMEARCYRGGKGRTRMNGMKFKAKDYFALVALLGFLILTVVLRKAL